MKKKRPPKTIKEKAWLAKAIEYGNGTKAAEEVYNTSTNESARAIASQNFAKLNVDDALKAKGMTIDYSLDKVKEGTNSKKIHGTNDDFIEVDDMPTRHRYLETLLRLQGHGPQATQVNTQVNVGKVYVELPKKESVIKGETLK